MLGFNRANLARSHEAPWLLLDLVMLVLLCLNLLWLIFDTLYATQVLQAALEEYWPTLLQAYRPVHQNFLLVDLGFIAVFLSEFILRWVAAIQRKTYLRWYFFPFVHWYDLVGCIPVSSARIFRFLRVFSILYRLHRYEIIDLKDTALFRFVSFYYNVFVEELSDRIVARVLTDAQKDIVTGSPLMRDIADQVLATRRGVVLEWVAAMAVHVGQSIADPEHGETVREHVRSSVGRAVRDNPSVSALKWVPVVGGGIERTLEDAVTDIVTQSVINLLTDITPDKLSHFVDKGLNRLDARESALEQEFILVVNECLELVKQHVSQQRWKEALKERDKLRSSDGEHE